MKDSKTPDRWSVVKNIIDRQWGINAIAFPQNYYGSSHAIQSLKPMHTIQNDAVFENQIADIRFNRKGNLIGSVYYMDDNVILWDWATAKKHLSLSTGHGFHVYQLDWMPLGTESLMVTTGYDMHLRLLDLATGTNCSLAEMEWSVQCPANHFTFGVHPGSPHNIIAGSIDGRIISVDIREKEAITLLNVKKPNFSRYDIFHIDLNPAKCHEFCIAGSSDDVRIYDRRNMAVPLQKLYSMHAYDEINLIMNMEYSYNGREIIVSYQHEPIYLFDTSKQNPSGCYTIGEEIVISPPETYVPPTRIYDLHFFGPKSEFVMAGTLRQIPSKLDVTNIYIWNKDTKRLIRNINPSADERSYRFACHPCIPVVAMNLNDRGIQLWG